MMAAMMGIDQENASSLVSDDDRRALIKSQFRLQAAQLEKQAIELEENKAKRQKLEVEDASSGESNDDE